MGYPRGASLQYKAWTMAYRIATANFLFEKLFASVDRQKQKRRIKMRLSLCHWSF
jgi:hypothetical protein